MGEPPSISRTPSRRSPRNHESSHRMCVISSQRLPFANSGSVHRKLTFLSPLRLCFPCPHGITFLCVLRSYLFVVLRSCSDNQETSGSRAGLTSRDNDIVQVAVAATVAQSRMSQGQAPSAQQTPNSNPLLPIATCPLTARTRAGCTNPSGVGGGANYVASTGLRGA